MIEINTKENCCGCYACYNVCPKQCITMKTDNEGFWYPDIDKDKCVNCNLCEKVCPIVNPVQRNESLKLSYAVQNKDDAVRLSSSSGGMFHLLAESIIKQDGVVYGAGFDKDFSVKHIRINKIEEIQLLQGSKYLQSGIGNIYKQVKKDLKENKQVLFTGTPCQVEGLKSFLGREENNLLTMDFICHGVPSPTIWGGYYSAIEQDKKEQLKKVYFRNKDLGWKLFSLKMVFDKNIYVNDLNNDLYMKGFLQDLYLRPSCYNCRFKKVNRVSDITVADFWGIDKLLPKFDDDKGTSLVILHNNKAKNLFYKLKDKMNFIEVKFEDGIRYNKSMITSVRYNEKRDLFFAEFKIKENLFDLIKKYTKLSFKRRIKQKIKFMIKTFIK